MLLKKGNGWVKSSIFFTGKMKIKIFLFIWDFEFLKKFFGPIGQFETFSKTNIRNP